MALAVRSASAVGGCGLEAGAEIGVVCGSSAAGPSRRTRMADGGLEAGEGEVAAGLAG